MIVKPPVSALRRRPYFFDIAGQAVPKVDAPKRKHTAADNSPWESLAVPKSYDVIDELGAQSARLEYAFMQRHQTHRGGGGGGGGPPGPPPPGFLPFVAPADVDMPDAPPPPPPPQLRFGSQPPPPPPPSGGGLFASAMPPPRLIPPRPADASDPGVRSPRSRRAPETFDISTPRRERRQAPYPYPFVRPIDVPIRQVAQNGGQTQQARTAQAIISATSAAQAAAAQQAAAAGTSGLLPHVAQMAVPLPPQSATSAVIAPQQVPGQPAEPPRRRWRARTLRAGGPYERNTSSTAVAPMVPRESTLPVLPPPPGPPSAPQPSTPDAGMTPVLALAERRPLDPETPAPRAPGKRFKAGALRPETPVPAPRPLAIEDAETPAPPPSRKRAAIEDGEAIPGPRSLVQPTRTMLAITDGEIIPGPRSLIGPPIALGNDPNREVIPVPRPRRPMWRAGVLADLRETPQPLLALPAPQAEEPAETPQLKKLRLRGKQPTPIVRR